MEDPQQHFVRGVAIETYFHWHLVANGALVIIVFAVGVLARCILREKTVSLWDCVLFHSSYNAIVRREWWLCAALMGVALVGIGWSQLRIKFSSGLVGTGGKFEKQSV